MHKKPAHLTLGGEPLCTCQTYAASLLGCYSPVPSEHRFCSFHSTAAAQRAKVEMQKHRYGIRVVIGHCPAYAESA